MAKQDLDIQVDETLENESSDPRVYELGFHIDPELPTEEVKKVYREIRDSIEEKGTIVAEGEPEKISLAYTISRQDTTGRRDFNSAYFSWIVYETSAEKHSDVISTANADKRIVRFIDLITTKDDARHSVEIRELSIKTPERTREPEEVIGAEIDAALENSAI